MSSPRHMLLPPGRTFVHPEVGDTVHYKDTYHVTDHFLFPRTTRTCDECFQPIPAGHFASSGEREWYPDAPYQLTNPTLDVVHIKCYLRSLDGPISSHIYTDPHKLKGWSHLSVDEKRAFLVDIMEWTDENKISSTLSIIPSWQGISVILCGEFDRAKDSISSDIESLGGVVVQTVTAKTNLCVLGRDGTTQYGQKTGKGSKKYKEVKKKKVPVVGVEWLDGALTQTDYSISDVVGRFGKGAVVEGPYDGQYGLGTSSAQDVKDVTDGKQMGESQSTVNVTDDSASNVQAKGDATASSLSGSSNKKRTRKAAATDRDSPPAKRVTRARAAKERTNA